MGPECPMSISAKNLSPGVSSEGRGRWGKPPGVVSDRRLAPWHSDQIGLAGLVGAVVEFRRFRLSPTGSTVVGETVGLRGAVSDVARLQLATVAFGVRS